MSFVFSTVQGGDVTLSIVDAKVIIMNRDGLVMTIPGEEMWDMLRNHLISITFPPPTKDEPFNWGLKRRCFEATIAKQAGGMFASSGIDKLPISYDLTRVEEKGG